MVYNHTEQTSQDDADLKLKTNIYTIHNRTEQVPRNHANTELKTNSNRLYYRTEQRGKRFDLTDLSFPCGIVMCVRLFHCEINLFETRVSVMQLINTVV